MSTLMGTQLRQCLKGNFTGHKAGEKKKKNELSIQLQERATEQVQRIKEDGNNKSTEKIKATKTVNKIKKLVLKKDY